VRTSISQWQSYYEAMRADQLLISDDIRLPYKGIIIALDQLDDVSRQEMQAELTSGICAQVKAPLVPLPLSETTPLYTQDRFYPNSIYFFYNATG
jgi:hypothetical protein